MREDAIIKIKNLLYSRNIRVPNLLVFCVIALLGIIELVKFGISPPIEMIKTVLQQYLLISYIYAFILFLLYFFYFVMGGPVEKDRGVLSIFGPLSMSGPLVPMSLSFMIYFSVFYMALVMLFHIFNGTFSNEFQLSELMILGVIMASLVFHCTYKPFLDMGRYIFIEKPVKSRR